MQQRRVTAPDNSRWIVGRRWLLHRPRYFGFRFGIDKQAPVFEPAASIRVKRRPAPTEQPTPPPVRYTTRAPRRPASGSRWSWWPGGGTRNRGRIRTSGGGSRSNGGLFRSSGGGSRSRSSGGGSRSRTSGGGKRGGGAGAGGAAIAGLLQFLVKAVKFLLIAAAVVAVALFVVFVAVPVLVFLAHYLAFWIVVALTIAYRAMTGRPWIVEMEEADGYRVRSWRVRGWRESGQVIHEIAEAIRSGREPTPSAAEEVEIENAR